MQAGESALPVLFLERLREIVPEQHLDGVLASFESPRALTLRVNRLRAEPAEVRAELAALEFELEPVPWCEDAFRVVVGERRSLQESAAYREGRVYLQGLSSMLAPLMLDPQPGESVLDLCAAPGSKTTQIAAMMGGEGELVANDRSHKRLYKLRRVLEEQGVRRVQILGRKGETIGRTHPGHFDRVLADVPCSSEGRFHLDDPKSWSDWKPSKIKRLGAEQRRLLISGLHALRPGGRLIYSTCTFAPEENEAVIHRVLRYFRGRAELVELPFEAPCSIPGMTTWRGRDLDPGLVRCRRILPGRSDVGGAPAAAPGGLEGFFLACLSRTEGEITGESDRST